MTTIIGTRVTWKEVIMQLGFHQTPICKCTSKYIPKIVIKRKLLSGRKDMLRCLPCSGRKLVFSLLRDCGPLSGSCLSSSYSKAMSAPNGMQCKHVNDVQRIQAKVDTQHGLQVLKVIREVNHFCLKNFLH
jgi:hypothetical protein